MSPIDQYLARYAEIESRVVPVSDKFDCLVTIPSLGEDLTRVTRSLQLAGLHSRTKFLTIIVVNNRTDHSSSLIETNYTFLQSLTDFRLIHPSLLWNGSDTLIVDRYHVPFPPKQGVGLARKIGCDIALRLIAEGIVKSPWIRCIDGDCEAPVDYFSIPQTDSLAILYPFEHILDWNRPDEAQALKDYDATLRYYVEGLKSAGSPYAYHSLGSTIAVRSDAYAAVRGFPKAMAAEDFYLLGKVRKLGNIESLKKPIIRIHQRISDRVPFGTGVSTKKFSENIKNKLGNETVMVYSPETFSRLKLFLSLCQTFADDPQTSLPDGVLWPKGAGQAWAIARKTRPTPQLRYRHLMEWFDAFRTLKYIHDLRDHEFPLVKLTDTRFHQGQSMSSTQSTHLSPASAILPLT